MLKIGHEVVRPGKRLNDEPVTFSIPEELETVPGVPANQREVDWYAREYPLESMNVTERASRDWANTVRDQHVEMREIRKEHEKLNRPLIMAARATGDLEPTVEPTGEDISQGIKDKARELGFVEVGITAFDPHYSYQSKKNQFTLYPHFVALAYEQDFEPTQTIPSVDAEIVHSSTYRTEGAAALELGNWIRAQGYHAQVFGSGDSVAVYKPMHVAAGVGQQAPPAQQHPAQGDHGKGAVDVQGGIMEAENQIGRHQGGERHQYPGQGLAQIGPGEQRQRPHRRHIEIVRHHAPQKSEAGQSQHYDHGTTHQTPLTLS